MINHDNSKSSDMNICALNIQGLKKFMGNSTFLHFCAPYDIIALSETWQENEKEFQTFLQDYTCFDCVWKKKRSARRGSGGAAVFIRDKLLQTGGVK